MKKTLIKMLFILFPFIFLTSCGGWQLRGYDASYGDKVMAYIDGDRSTALANALRTAFRERGVNVTSNAGNAEILVDILSSDFRRRIVSLDPQTGKVRELEIQLFSEVAIRSRSYGLLMPRQAMRLQRDYFFDELAAEFTTIRGEVIEADLAKDWAFSVVYRALSTLKKQKTMR